MNRKIKFDPVSRCLFSHDGDFLKVVRCPKNISKASLVTTSKRDKWECPQCDRAVLDIRQKEEWEVVKILNQDPDLCIMLSLDQKNLEVIHKNV